MEIEKAIKLLKADKNLISRKVTRHTFYEYEEAVQALEKQIPKKPVWRHDTQLCCSNCGAAVYRDVHWNYCQCGQKIDWEDEQ
ncbi:MAG TPA: hypothetical protein DCM73_12470 [Clostridiales bacterium]|nr:hypothetical protein [Clostridiales bacterium]